MQVGSKIRRIRELKNITPKEMADRLDMSLQGYSKIERDEVTINLERLVQVAEVFEMKPEEVMTFDEKYVFNNNAPHYSNNVGTNNIHFPEEIRKLYEDKISLLEDKIKYQEEKIKWLESR